MRSKSTGCAGWRPRSPRFIDGDGAAPLPSVAGDFELTGSRPIGATRLLDGLWKRLGVDAALRRVLGARRYSTDIERVLFALVANRALGRAMDDLRGWRLGRVVTVVDRGFSSDENLR